MPPEVVTNAGPLMVFSKLNVLHLLKELYGRVHFPVSVYRETVTVGMQRGFQDARSLHLFLEQNGWKPTAVAEIPENLEALHLDQGERESIFLAITKNALLLMDEERGRAVARERRLIVKGSIGVLVEAYRKGLINFDRVRFYFEQIIERPDIWISPTLCARVLEGIPRP
jgi:predicted nucleic acid-binding protein